MSLLLTFFSFKLKMELMAKNYPLYILAGALFIFGLSLGFFAGKQFGSSEKIQSEQQQVKESNQLFSSQTASIRAEITEVDGVLLSVKNLNNNLTGKIKASNELVISKPGNNKLMTGVSEIELNKEALISLQMIDNSYLATAIQYVTPSPSLPPIVAPGVKTSKPPSSNNP